MSAKKEYLDSTISFGEILVLNELHRDAKIYKYLVVHQKQLSIATFFASCLKKIGISNIEYGSIASVKYKPGKDCRSIHVSTCRSIVDKLSSRNDEPWSDISVEFSDSLQKSVIHCPALTTGCFTYENVDFSTPCAFNNALGILVDKMEEPKVPKKAIGHLKCAVMPELVDGNWQLTIVSVYNFERVNSACMATYLEEDEHYGLVTRVESDETRDLRLISTRDFPRDVRIFRAGFHCCEAPSGRRRSFSLSNGIQLFSRNDSNNHEHDHDHENCVDTGVKDLHLLGVSVAMKVKKCRGIGLGFGPCAVEGPGGADGMGVEGGIGYHVDGRHVQRVKNQLKVHVHGGFVELETLCEYSGHTDHNDLPLLWSHDVEFVVDFCKSFEGKPAGLYVVNAVRFHRPNVFAKWRLARRSPIVLAIGKRDPHLEQRSALSINLGSLSIGIDKMRHSFGQQNPFSGSGLRMGTSPSPPPSLNNNVSPPVSLGLGNHPVQSRFCPRMVTPPPLLYSQALIPIDERPQRRHVSCSFLPSSDNLDDVDVFDVLLENCMEQRRLSTSSSTGTSRYGLAEFFATDGDDDEATLVELEKAPSTEEDGSENDAMWQHHNELTIRMVEKGEETDDSVDVVKKVGGLGSGNTSIDENGNTKNEEYLKKYSEF